MSLGGAHQSCAMPLMPWTNTITGARSPPGGISPKKMFGAQNKLATGAFCAGTEAGAEAKITQAKTRMRPILVRLIGDEPRDESGCWGVKTDALAGDEADGRSPPCRNRF